ncbi:hypothetical protein MG293_007845 [Ovis ammon polii]|uniref:Uncharacterized protein n=1 Tax=Ovis ammon polii TaxID=230172 RepID=A0AAD4UAJ3_OVIAM|nr:hypothetical protein MG293_007845 [Ovis ammon polii]
MPHCCASLSDVPPDLRSCAGLRKTSLSAGKSEAFLHSLLILINTVTALKGIRLPQEELANRVINLESTSPPQFGLSVPQPYKDVNIYRNLEGKGNYKELFIMTLDTMMTLDTHTYNDITQRPSTATHIPEPGDTGPATAQTLTWKPGLKAVTVELSSKYHQEKQQSRARESGGRDSQPSPVRLLVLSAKFKRKLLLQRKQLGNTRLAEELLHTYAFGQRS